MSHEMGMKKFILFFLLLESVNANLEFVISSLSVSFSSSINSYLPSCYGVDLELFVQITTSNYTDQTTFIILEQDANAYSVSFNNNSDFIVPSPTNFISISSILSMKCSTSQISDTFLLFTQYYSSADLNNQNMVVSPVSTNNKWTLSANVFRKCNGNNEYGFNCNEQCTSVDNQYYCYTCGSNGQKVCCQYVNQDDCSYYDTGGTSTIDPYQSQCSDTAENTYFWLMIAFIITTAILLIIVLCLILKMCCYTSTKNTARSEDEWNDTHPRANRTLYDRDIHRRRRDEQLPDNFVADSNHNMPYFIDREGIDNRNFGESESSEYEMQLPRRIARV